MPKEKRIAFTNLRLVLQLLICYKKNLLMTSHFTIIGSVNFERSSFQHTRSNTRIHKYCHSYLKQHQSYQQNTYCSCQERVLIPVKQPTPRQFIHHICSGIFELPAIIFVFYRGLVGLPCILGLLSFSYPECSTISRASIRPCSVGFALPQIVKLSVWGHLTHFKSCSICCIVLQSNLSSVVVQSSI